MTKKLVLSGYYGYDNAGDEAVLLSILQKLKQENITPIVLSGNPEKTRSLYSVDSVNRYNLLKVMKAIKQSDGLISGGGSLLQDVTSFKSIFYYLGIIRMAHFFKKPVFCYAQGIGPLTKKLSLSMTNSVLSNCTYLSVRDTDSKRLLEEIGIKNQIDLSIDPVLGLEKSSDVSVPESLLSFLKKKPIVISIRPWGDSVKVIQETKILVSRLIEKELPVLFLPFHHPYDLEISNQVAEDLGSSPLIYVQQEELNVDQVIEVISHSKMVVGMRLHSLIISASQNIPFIGISYDPKIDAFLELYGKKPITNTEEYHSEALLHEINRVMLEEEKEIESIRLHYKEIQKRLNLPIEAIRANL